MILLPVLLAVHARAAEPGIRPPAPAQNEVLLQAEKDERALPDDQSRWKASVELARLAWLAGDDRKAKRYAHRALQQAGRFHKDPAYGDAVYTGHEIQGLLALKKGDLEKAERELVDAAAKGPGSEKLSAEGPDMTLAKGVLERGGKDAVVKFLASCEKLWPAGKDSLASWRAAVEKGERPDLSGYARL
jgi:hypothetical protein